MNFYQLTWTNTDDGDADKREYFSSKVEAIRRYNAVKKEGENDNDIILIASDSAIQKFTFNNKKELLRILNNHC